MEEQAKHSAEERQFMDRFSPFSWLQSEIKDTRLEVRDFRLELRAVESGLRQEIGSLRQEIKQGLGSLRVEIAGLRGWVIATFVAVVLSAIGMALFR